MVWYYIYTVSTYMTYYYASYHAPFLDTIMLWLCSHETLSLSIQLSCSGQNTVPVLSVIHAMTTFCEWPLHVHCARNSWSLLVLQLVLADDKLADIDIQLSLMHEQMTTINRPSWKHAMQECASLLTTAVMVMDWLAVSHHSGAPTNPMLNVQSLRLPNLVHYLKRCHKAIEETSGRGGEWDPC